MLQKYYKYNNIWVRILTAFESLDCIVASLHNDQPLGSQKHMPPRTLKIIFCFKSENSGWVSSNRARQGSNLGAIFWNATCRLLCADGRVDLTFLRCLSQAGCED